jgi:hypothetical protein
VSRRWVGGDFTGSVSYNAPSSGAHTLCVWVYNVSAPNASSTGGDCFYLDPNGGAGGSICFIGFGWDGANTKWSFKNEAGNGSDYSFFASGTLTGVWTHLAMTYNGSNSCTAYLNGVAVNTATCNLAGRGNLNWFDFGASDDSTYSDACFFTAELTASQIQEVMNQRFSAFAAKSLYSYHPLYNDNVRWDASGRGNLLGTTGGLPGTLFPPIANRPPGNTVALRTLAIVSGTTITGAATTASSATAAVSFAQNIPINATASTASSASAAVSVTQAITAAATTASSAAAAMLANLPITAAGTTASSASAAVSVKQAITAAATTASSATAAVSVSTSTNITAAATTASSAAAAVSVNQAISAAATTASSATAAVSLTQVINITAAAQSASSASASFGSVGFQLTAAGQTASSAQAAIGSLLQAAATSKSTGAAAFTSASFPIPASATTASFATANMTSSGGGGGGVGGDDGVNGWRRWALALGRRRTRR